MLDTAKSLKDSLFVQRMYRRYVQPHLPQYEPETYILRAVKFDQCVDVGAHAGTYSILLSHNSDRVYAFEPTGHSFDILQALNIPNVSVYNLALGSESGEMEISLPRVGGETDFALATLRPLSAHEYDKVDIQKVRIAKFDDFANEIDFVRIDFVKIDVEGFEMQVLQGMQRLVESKKPALLIEIERRHNPNYRDVFDYLAGRHYAAYITVDGVALQRFDIEQLPGLQSNESLKMDEGRKFRMGERKNYINNFFFLQPGHSSQFRLK
jgi:FkbM family methyltransferase